MDYIIKMRMSDELLNQAKHAAASLGISAADYLRVALLEKVERWASDETGQKESVRIAKYLMEQRREVYERLAQGPTT